MIDTKQFYEDPEVVLVSVDGLLGRALPTKSGIVVFFPGVSIKMSGVVTSKWRRGEGDA